MQVFSPHEIIVTARAKMRLLTTKNGNAEIFKGQFVKKRGVGNQIAPKSGKANENTQRTPGPIRMSMAKRQY